ncbi:hypothetical protein DEO72_LG8g1414 [Vigna unguiculata]|uniref:Uncharacterized protein n=1 Tax=Vigna unguiculata TaxID=3917 RepID=A0A4D6MPD4_VIGUN|nr:hypothetical protein DEO72_LG8g1414 [Vigna unguiculata]
MHIGQNVRLYGNLQKTRHVLLHLLRQSSPRTRTPDWPLSLQFAARKGLVAAIAMVTGVVAKLQRGSKNCDGSDCVWHSRWRPQHDREVCERWALLMNDPCITHFSLIETAPSTLKTRHVLLHLLRQSSPRTRTPDWPLSLQFAARKGLVAAIAMVTGVVAKLQRGSKNCDGSDCVWHSRWRPQHDREEEERLPVVITRSGQDTMEMAELSKGLMRLSTMGMPQNLRPKTATFSVHGPINCNSLAKVL